MTVKCCVCTKTRIDDQWLETETKTNEQVSHSYCPACLDAALAELTTYGQATCSTGATQHTHQTARV